MAFFSHQPFSGFQLSFLFRISALNIKDFTRKFVILSLKKYDNLFLSSTFFQDFSVPFLLFTFYSHNSKYYIPLLFCLTSSLHKQPFTTAHFRSSLHILCITAR